MAWDWDKAHRCLTTLCKFRTLVCCSVISNIKFLCRLWPEYVKQRIHNTYAYFGGSVLISAASAVAIFRSPTLLNLAARGGWIPMIASMALMIGSGMVARSIPYEPGLGTKQLAWAAHCAIIGGVLAPLSFVGGPILLRAAMYTAGIVGGLSTVAVCAPSDKFLYMGGPLAIGLGVVFAASMGSMFLPPTTVYDDASLILIQFLLINLGLFRH